MTEAPGTSPPTVATSWSVHAPIVCAAVAAALLAVGSFMRWAVVRFDGVLIRELSASGWSRGDGKITVLVGIGAAILAVLLITGRTDRWITIVLGIGALVGVVDVVLDLLEVTGTDAASDIASSLGVRSDGITSTYGNGALVTGLGALGLALAAALLETARR